MMVFSDKQASAIGKSFLPPRAGVHAARAGRRFRRRMRAIALSARAKPWVLKEPQGCLRRLWASPLVLIGLPKRHPVLVIARPCHYLRPLILPMAVHSFHPV